jgi:hypothetical protein
MNEKELATELQATKDDPDEWGEPEAPARSQGRRQRLAAMVSVRFTPDELEYVQRRAEESGQTVSAYLRSVAVAPATLPEECVWFGVTNTSETYSVHVANPWLMSDGQRLATSHAGTRS